MPGRVAGQPIQRHHQKKLATVIFEIRDRPEIKISVKALAVQCGYSPDHFTASSDGYGLYPEGIRA